MSDLNERTISSLYKLTLLTNIIKLIVSITFGLAMVPINLKYFGVDRYGIWLVINSILAYVSMTNLGLNAAVSILTNKMENELEKIRVLNRGALLITISMFFIFSVLFFIDFYIPNWVNFLGDIPENLTSEVKLACVTLVLFFLVNIPFSLISSILNGFHKVYIENVFQIISSVLLFLAVIVNVNLIDGDLVSYAVLIGAAGVVTNFLRLVYYYVFIYNRVRNGCTVKFSNESSYKNIFITGVHCFVGGIASLVILNSDNFIISHFLGVEFVSKYAITFKVFTILFTIIYILNSSIIPIVGRMIVQKDFSGIKIIYDKSFHFIIWIGGGLCIGGISFSKCLITTWAGSESYAGFFTVISICFYSYMFCLVNLNYIMLNTFAATKAVLWIVIFEACLNLTLSIILIDHIGIAGVAIGTALGILFGPMLMFPIVLKNKTKGVVLMDFSFVRKHMLIIVLPFSLIAMLINIEITVFLFNFLMTIALLMIYSVFCFMILPLKYKEDLTLKLKKSVSKTTYRLSH